MAVYLVGDIQGCKAELDSLLRQVDFSPSRDVLYPLGDLVDSGLPSIAVLRTLMALGDSAKPVLGNHDLHWLAIVAGLSATGTKAQALLQAPDKGALLTWLRTQPLARHAHGVLMVHAGVLPHWDCHETLAWATRLQAMLQAPDWRDQLKTLWGDHPTQWHGGLNTTDALRLALNALTRIRFCSADGVINLGNKTSTSSQDNNLPWFDVPKRQSASTPIAFGHWSAMGLVLRPKLAGLDTGCVWGGKLSALCFADTTSINDLRSGTLLQTASLRPHKQLRP